MSLKAYVMIEGALQIVVISIKAAHNTFLKITSKVLNKVKTLALLFSLVKIGYLLMQACTVNTNGCLTYIYEWKLALKLH